MEYTLNIFKFDKRTKTGERLVGTYTFDRRDDNSMQREVDELHLHHYPVAQFRLEFYQKYKTVKNLMTGKDVEIDRDTPWCCNPASETYWSM